MKVKLLVSFLQSYECGLLHRDSRRQEQQAGAALVLFYVYPCVGTCVRMRVFVCVTFSLYTDENACLERRCIYVQAQINVLSVFSFF